MDEPELTEDEPPKPPPERTIRKVLRLVAYAVFVCTVVAVLAFRSSYASMKQNALELGDELGKLGDVGKRMPILLNGQRIHVASSVMEMSVAETLDRAETLCEKGAAMPWTSDPGSSPAELLDTATTELATGKSPARWLMRQEESGRGVVLCFAPPEGQEHEDGIRDRVRRVMNFLTTGDLEAIGRLRYLYARETDSGRTQLIGVWTDGPFNFYAMAPQGDGDTPGSDPQDAPRPPDSVRLLSATIEVAPYAVRIYETPHTPSDVAAAYDRQMPELGWRLLVPDGDARVYQKDDITVFVTPTVHEGRVQVSMLHMGSDR